jgi:hypothetical protein
MSANVDLILAVDIHSNDVRRRRQRHGAQSTLSTIAESGL